jgi:hypothetical protein
VQIILYTTHCPRCTVLEKKLKQKNILYLTIDDEEIMRKEGFTEVPMMKVGSGNPMNFKQANDWINKWGDFYG